MTVYLVYGTTESGDDWNVIFANPPTDEDIQKYIDGNAWLHEEDEAGCITGWKVEPQSVQAN